MKKAKAAFAGIVIIAVAGASAALWYLNDKGLIGNDEPSSSDGYIYVQENNENNKYNNNILNNDDNDNNGNKDENIDEPNNDKTINNEEINEFLSIFSRTYFAENEYGYSRTDHSSYDLIKFAYSHIKRTSPEKLLTEENDEFGMYSGVSYDDVNDVLSEYLDLNIRKESVYTENKYMFFEYKNGAFYTPAADGVGFSNIVVADSAEISEGVLSVEFTIYSYGADCSMTAEQAHENGKKYGSGTAKITVKNGKYILDSYNITV